LKDLVEYLAKALVDEPEQVNVTEVQGERVTVIELRVAQTDLGKVWTCPGLVDTWVKLPPLPVRAAARTPAG